MSERKRDEIADLLSRQTWRDLPLSENIVTEPKFIDPAYDMFEADRMLREGLFAKEPPFNPSKMSKDAGYHDISRTIPKRGKR